jgi:hypothetical protein
MENVKTGQDGLLDAAGRGGHARYKAYRELMERLKKLEADGVFGPSNGSKRRRRRRSPRHRGEERRL